MKLKLNPEPPKDELGGPEFVYCKKLPGARGGYIPLFFLPATREPPQDA